MTMNHNQSQMSNVLVVDANNIAGYSGHAQIAAPNQPHSTEVLMKQPGNSNQPYMMNVSQCRCQFSETLFKLISKVCVFMF